MDLARLGTRLAASLALAALGAASLAPPAAANAISPEPPASPNADELTAIYWVMLAVAAALVIAVNVALIVAVVRFRARRGRRPVRVRGGARVQGRAASVGVVLAAAIFTVGVVYTERARDVEPSGPEGLEAASARTAQLGLSPPGGDSEPLEIDVTGQQWVWRYEYPDGTFSYYELVVPVDTTVLLEIGSTDVVHTWWIPSLGGKFDAVPGSTNEAWFRADSEGVYEGQSATFSGPGYAAMRARVRAVSVPEFQSWLDRQGNEIQAAQEAVQRRIDPGDVPGVSP